MKTELKRNLLLSDMYSLNFMSEGRLSPDGKYIVYRVTTTDKEKEEDRSVLWLFSLETEESRQLTGKEFTARDAVWSIDGRQIAYISNQGGNPQIYLYNLEDDQVNCITTLPQGVGGGLDWSPDGEYIAFTAGKLNKPFDGKNPYRITRHMYRLDGAGYVENFLQDIYLLRVNNKEIIQLTHSNKNYSRPRWSPHGKEILCSITFEPDEPLAHQQKLEILDTDGNLKQKAAQDYILSDACWLPDGKNIVFCGRKRTSPLEAVDSLWTLDLHSGETINRTPSLKNGVGPGLQGDTPVVDRSRLMVSADGRFAFCGVQFEGSNHIYQISLAGKENWFPLLEGKRSTALLGLNGSRILYSTSSLLSPADLYMCNQDGHHERQITFLNRNFMRNINLPEIDNFHFNNEDGLPIEGWLMKPPIIQKPYPTILFIHGGPRSAYGNIFSFDFLSLAGAGYAVLFVNPCGSVGYGSDYTRPINQDFGNKDYKDLMAAVDLMVEKGLSDPERLGVCGCSYGGFMTCWICGHTNRFKAAMAENPVTNFFSMFGTTDMQSESVFAELGGAIHEVPENYIKCSPIFYAHNCTTPMLLLQGEKDYRCPIDQSEQFYAVLKHNKQVVEMVRVPDGSHEFARFGNPLARRIQNEVLLDWMNRYLMNDHQNVFRLEE